MAHNPFDKKVTLGTISYSMYTLPIHVWCLVLELESVSSLTLPCVMARSVVETIVCTSFPPILALSVAWRGEGVEEGERMERMFQNMNSAWKSTSLYNKVQDLYLRMSRERVYTTKVNYT